MFNQETKKLPIEHSPKEALRLYLHRLLFFFAVVAINIIFFGVLLVMVNDLALGIILVMGLLLVAILYYISRQIQQTQKETIKTQKELIEIQKELKLVFEKLGQISYQSR